LVHLSFHSFQPCFQLCSGIVNSLAKISTSPSQVLCDLVVSDVHFGARVQIGELNVHGAGGPQPPTFLGDPVTAFETILAALPETQLTLGGFLITLHRQGRLDPLIQQALAAQFVQDQARNASLSVAPEELQTAADEFRRRNQLLAAADLRAWLTARRLSLDDFERMLQQEVLAARFRQHVVGASVDSHFAAQSTGLQRLRLALVIVGREDMAREMATQVRDEDRDLEEVAREQGLEVIRSDTLRKDLKEPLAAALAAAKPQQLVGPIATRRGFVLIRIEQIQTATMDPATRQRLEGELFAAWLAAQLRQARIDLDLTGVPG